MPRGEEFRLTPTCAVEGIDVDEDRRVGHRLLESGAVVGFRIIETKVDPSPDKETFSVSAELELGEGDDEDPANQPRLLGFRRKAARGNSAVERLRPRKCKGVQEFIG